MPGFRGWLTAGPRSSRPFRRFETVREESSIGFETGIHERLQRRLTIGSGGHRLPGEAPVGSEAGDRPHADRSVALVPVEGGFAAGGCGQGVAVVCKRVSQGVRAKADERGAGAGHRRLTGVGSRRRQPEMGLHEWSETAVVEILLRADQQAGAAVVEPGSEIGLGRGTGARIAAELVAGEPDHRPIRARALPADGSTSLLSVSQTSYWSPMASSPAV